MPGKWKTSEGKPVVALDIDGTLGDYHAHFLWFAEKYLGRPMPDPKDINPGLPLFRFMHVSKATYRQVKLAYRQGGLKRWMPCYQDASQLTRNIRRAGAELWICTTRPYLRLDTVDPDTREWLRRNRIAYDAVIFGERKYRDLVRQVGQGRIVAAADDQVADYQAAQNAGIYRVYLMDQPYNRHDVCALRMFSLRQLGMHVMEDIETWKQQTRNSVQP